MSDRYSSGRFEWITIPSGKETPEVCDDINDVFLAKTCLACGWIDGDYRFEAMSGTPGNRECFRCGAHWDLTNEITDFFKKEHIRIPSVRSERRMADAKGFYRGIKDSDPRIFDLRMQAESFCLRKGFDELLSLCTAKIDRFDHQVNTAKAVLKRLKVRALLADEVGMGKTVEAGIIIKELLLRGIASSVLILVPAGLTSQWQEEIQYKFDEKFQIFKKHTLDKSDCRLIASYDLAKRRKCLQSIPWDMLILDEIHRLKSRRTAVSKFVRGIQSRFIIGMSATPVMNSLCELHALIDLIKPGKLGTVRTFKRTFVSRSNPRKVIPGREAALRNELSEIMIRNRRDACKIKFPKRRAGVFYVEPTAVELDLYKRVTNYVKEEFKKQILKETGRNVHMLSLIIIQRELMSTPAAVQKTLLKIARRKDYPESTQKRLNAFAEMAGTIEAPSKIDALQEILTRFDGKRFVVFTEFLKSLEFIKEQIAVWGRSVFSLSGSMSTKQRTTALEAFRKTPSAVLVATETGGVGLNLQFCSHLVNYDLPWNPLRVEQRIGRLDRIGQKHEVYVFNLVCQHTIEEYVVDILAKKLRMFEMVIGECGAVLGHMEPGKSFEQMIVDVWINTFSKKEEADGFSRLAVKAEKARSLYNRTRQASSVLGQIGRCA